VRVTAEKLVGGEVVAFMRDATAFVRSRNRDVTGAQALVRDIRALIDGGTPIVNLRGYLQVKPRRVLLSKIAEIAGYRFAYDLLVTETGWDSFAQERRRRGNHQELSEDDLRVWFEGLNAGTWTFHPAELREDADAARRASERREKLQREFTVELVPRGCWGRNLRSLLTEEAWEELRGRWAKRAGNACEICLGKGGKWPVEIHEEWQYDDHAHVQHLQGLIALCPDCHELKHWGRTKNISPGARLEAVARLKRFRLFTTEEAEQFLADAERRVRQRSEHEWRVDLSWLSTEGCVPLQHPRVVEDA
jgi:hypothetical protein